MKKRLLSFLLIALLLAALLPSALGADVVLSGQNLTVNGVSIRCEKYNIDGSNYFKLRDMAFLLNGTESQFAVGYDAESRTVTITSGSPYESNGTELMFSGEDKSATAVPSSQTILIDGAPVEDLSVYNIGGNNFFKLRDLGAAVGFRVDYDAETNTAVVLSGMGEAAPVLQEMTPEQIYARCAPAVFYIEIYDESGWHIKNGSGFFLTSDGLAITNYHVISGASSASITVSDTGEVYQVAGVYDYSVDEDWAVLQIDGSGFQTLEIGAADYDVGGATVYAIGSPLGLQNTISSGIISNPARIDGGMTYIQMSAAISPGSSGGALLNKYGQVIGITSATYTEGQNLNLAIPMTYLEKMDTSGYSPLSNYHSNPTGTLTLSTARLNLGLNETGSVTVTAIEQNCDETVSVRYVIGDTDIVSCSWGGWVGDDNTLIINPLRIGNTDVTVYFLINGTETVLDAKTLSVTVTSEGSSQIEDDTTIFYVDNETLFVGLFGQGEIHVHGHTDYLDDPNHHVYATYYVGDSSIAECSWSSWDGDDITLFVSPLATGSTEITLVYHLEDDTVLAQETVTVYVVFGSISVSEDELGMTVGETVTLAVTGLTEGDDEIDLFLNWNTYGDDILTVEWGDWQEDGVTCDLYITAHGPGEADVEITIEDEEGNLVLDCISIPVSVE
jgi:hypothetical protein